ncbi:MAG: hypothetical protein J5676_07070 [Bacteroidaceae bacterium]|nr:hypothetical protein [Bacteroidaceae bacterium]
MTKYFLILLLAISVVSCESSRNTNKPTNNAAKDTGIAERDTIRNYLNRMLNTDVARLEQRVLDSMYFSNELLSLQEQCTKKCFNKDWNHWVDNEIVDKTSFKIGTIERKQDNTIYADITTQNKGYETSEKIILVLEDASWKVDDLVFEDYSYKANLRKYLNLPTPLKGALSDYSIKYNREEEDNHVDAEEIVDRTYGHICLMKKGKVISKIKIPDMDRNAEFEFECIENTYMGFNLYFRYGHNHLRSSNILVFKFDKNQFLLKKIIRYDTIVVEDGFDTEKTVKILEKPLPFDKVNLVDYL